jgi:hypothetical protein
VPAAAKVWIGLRVGEVAPSPKLHDQATTVPSASVLPSVKVHSRSSQDVVKRATGAWFAVLTDTVFVACLLMPSVLVTVKVTV